MTRVQKEATVTSKESVFGFRDGGGKRVTVQYTQLLSKNYARAVPNTQVEAKWICSSVPKAGGGIK